MEGVTPLRHPQPASNAPLSSSPAFATPAHPITTTDNTAPVRQKPSIARPAFARPATVTTSVPPQDSHDRPAPVLSILLPPATLRPIAFRTFTKKHNLTLTSSALQSLATFIGRHCGSRWREDGLAEAVLEETAKSWKKGDGKVIVDAETDRLKNILKQLEGSLVGGKIVTTPAGARSLSGESSATSDILHRISSGLGKASLDRQESQSSVLSLDQDDDDGSIDDADDLGSMELRGWCKVVSAYDQPRLVFNPSRKHFEKSKTAPSMLPAVAQRTELFRQRYHLMHQRLLRNESFQTSTTGRVQQSWKITSISNLLGRSGSGHLLLGLLHAAPTGQLAISDLTGSVLLDLDQATPLDDVETWICPGMIVLVDGIYEEEYGAGSSSLSGSGGIGGTISGRFVGFSIGAPRTETRHQSLGLSDAMGGDGGTVGGGFGWVDFLGVGSERAVGGRMRRIEQKLLAREATGEPALLDSSRKLVVLGQLALDDPETISTLRKILSIYATAAKDLSADSTTSAASTLPTGFLLFGSFINQPALSNPSSHSAAQEASDSSSIAYKEAFDTLAALLHDFPLLLRHCTFVFVPGDNDAWSSSFSAGASVPLPHARVPEMFTSRIKREFAAANADSIARERETRGAVEHVHGQAVWTSNPARLSLFGPAHEIVLFRDDASGRLRRNAVHLKKSRGEEEEDERGEVHSDSGISMSGEATTSSPAAGAAAEGDPMQVDGDDNNDIQEQATKPATAAAAAATPPTTLQHARKLTKTLLDQTHLSPYPLATRPVHWSYAHALSLFPLPSALVLCDAEVEAFSLVYQGCCVVNAGRLVGPAGNGSARNRACWVEYDLVTRRGAVRDLLL